jgi:hypothetical protein
MARVASRVGAIVLSLGLACLGVAFALPVDATPSAPAAICSNQQGTSSDCIDPAPVGTVTTEVRDGGVVFRITAAEGTTWNRLALCIPGATPSPSNDCDTTSVSVLSPADGDYTVAGVSGLSTTATSAGFDCAASLTVTVPRETLAGVNSPFPWALELTNCAGGSDEAFGSVTRGAPSSADYECTGATGVSATGATLGASTTDASVTAVQFVLTQGSTATLTDTNGADGFSATFTGLTPNTVYAYTARFLAASGDKIASEPGCLFATPAGATTTTTSSTTSTTTSSTTSTTTSSTTSTTAPNSSTTTSTTTAPTTTTTAPTTTTTATNSSTTTSTTPASTTSTTATNSSTTTSTTPGSTSTTAIGATTTTGATRSTVTTPTSEGVREAVLPATITRGDTPEALAANAAAANGTVAPAPNQAASAQLARTGPGSPSLAITGVTLVGLGAIALLFGRSRRPDDFLVPAPIDHPRVSLGQLAPPSAPATRRVVVRED